MDMEEDNLETGSIRFHDGQLLEERNKKSSKEEKEVDAEKPIQQSKQNI